MGVYLATTRLALTNRALVWLGACSYSLYLLHNAMFMIAGHSLFAIAVSSDQLSFGPEAKTPSKCICHTPRMRDLMIRELHGKANGSNRPLRSAVGLQIGP